jgi:hypothetical protein
MSCGNAPTEDAAASRARACDLTMIAVVGVVVEVLEECSAIDRCVLMRNCKRTDWRFLRDIYNDCCCRWSTGSTPILTTNTQSSSGNCQSFYSLHWRILGSVRVRDTQSMDWRKQDGNKFGIQALSTVWKHISLALL